MTPDIRPIVVDVLGAETVARLDPPVSAYLFSYVESVCADEGKSPEDTEVLEEMFSVINPFLLSLECVEEEEDAKRVVDRLFYRLKAIDAIVPGKRQTLKTLAKPVLLSRELYGDDGPEVTVDINTNDDIEWKVKNESRLVRMKSKKADKYRKDLADKEDRKRILRARAFVKIHHTAESAVLRDKQLDIHMVNFGLTAGSSHLLEGTSLTMAYGRRYGLVGRNGTGKTSLLRAIVNREVDGISPYLQILHIEQEAAADERTALQTILQTDVEREDLLAEERKLQDLKEREGGDEEAEDMVAARLNAIYRRMTDIDAHSAEAKASMILCGLGFTPEMQQKLTREFSGGWRMRLALAQALFISPDILLLDEPTNHLDIRAVMWLENFLLTWNKTVVIVSHDRQFLNTVVTDVVHLQNLKLTQYRGNYDTFERVRTERARHLRSARDAQEKYRAHVQQFIDRFRYKAKISSRVQSRIKTLQKLDVIPAVIEDPSLSFCFPDPDKVSGALLWCDALTFGFTRERILFNNISVSLDMDSRVAMVGRNGVGKSTFLNVLTNELVPIEGYVRQNQKCRLARFHQHHVDQLNLTQSPVEYFMTRFPGSDPQAIRGHLGGFGITGPTALQSIDTLSGGQKSRVVFAYLTWLKPHILLLDEPSNHLDIDTVDVLIQALNAYGGGIFIISHDEHLINSVCDEIWILEDDRSITKFTGGFEEYKAKFKEEDQKKPA